MKEEFFAALVASAVTLLACLVKLRCRVAQPVARQPHKLKAAGSSPASAPNL